MKKAFLHLHLAVALAGATGVLGRLISLNEALLVWYRLILTVIILLVIRAWKKQNQQVNFREAAAITLVGAVVAMHWVAFYGSIKYANVSVALVCFSTVGFFSALLDPLLHRRRPDIIEVLLGLIAVAGVFLIFHFDAKYKVGIVFGLVAAMLAALFTIMNKGLLKKHDPSTVTLYELGGGLLVMTVLLPFYLYSFNLKLSLPVELDWLWLVILSWCCTVWAFYLSLNALRKISSFTVNLSYNLEPVYGILLAFLIFKENQYLHGSFYLGLLLIIIAVSVQMWRIYRKTGKR
ncbi:MAG TPA: EamA family transporter [Parasegetibacter sp.]